MSLGEMKKKALADFFNEAVRGALLGDWRRLEKAGETALSLGLTEADIGWVSEMIEQPNPEKFKKIFGENAVAKDVQELMRKADEESPQQAHFKGFYPEPK